MKVHLIRFLPITSEYVIGEKVLFVKRMMKVTEIQEVDSKFYRLTLED